MTPDEFINWLGPKAATVAHKWNLPASVLIAQGALESGWGRYVIGDYNIFGRKWNGIGPYIVTETQEWSDTYGYYTIEDRFQDYNSLEEACEDWCILMAEEPAYAEAWQIWSNTFDVASFVYAMGSVYATDPDYANKVLSIIDANTLQAYDDYGVHNA